MFQNFCLGSVHHLLDRYESLRLVNVEARYRGGYESQTEERGFCIKTEITLLSDGTFQYRMLKSGLNPGGPTTSFCENNAIGTWHWKYTEKEEAQLILHFQSNTELIVGIGFGQGKGLLLEGKRFFVEEQPTTIQDNSFDLML